MTNNLFKTPEYSALMQKHIADMIGFLFQKDVEFAVACDTRYIAFSPELPASIKDTFNQTVLFIIGGYSFESAQLNEGVFSFEAGFGSENFGSLVSIPLLAIKQIFVEDNPIVISFATPLPQKKKEESVLGTIVKNASKNASMEALLSNPENKKLLKVKKKS